MNHQPNLDTPISAGAFSLSEITIPQYAGYFTAKDGETPLYLADFASPGTSPFTVGETVTGQSSGVSKTYAGTVETFQAGNSLAFDMDVVFDRLDEAAGFERFTAGEVLDGSIAGVGAATLSSQRPNGRVFDTTSYGIGVIPRTVTATHRLEYDGGSGMFTEGETLTATGKSATICQVYDNGDGTGTLYLRAVSGTFLDNETITDRLGGSARADGDVRSAGTGALWMPAERNPALGAALHDPVALLDFFGNRRPAYPSKGAFEAAF